MITLVFIFGSVLATSVVLFFVFRQGKFTRRYALFLAAFAALATITSLMYSRSTVEESTEAQLRALTTGISSFERCGPVDPANSLCYNRVDQFGYPLPVATTTYKDTPEGPTSDTRFARKRATGLFGNYLVYLAVGFVLVGSHASIDKLARRLSRRTR